MSAPMNSQDQRFMAAALRYGRRHLGLTSTNPSVATFLVDETSSPARIVGRGVTAQGGRPHAERVAIDDAGVLAKGSTAYVTLEPCAHHGVTPPCAQALIDADIAKIVTSYVDPDARVDGEGHAMLRAAGIDVIEGVLSDQAGFDLAGYLTRTAHKRPHVHLKLAISRDGKLGLDGQEIAITGTQTKAQVHLMRAQTDAIVIGAGTLRADDPDLTCRLPGMENRSPTRIVLAGTQPLDTDARVFQSARHVRTILVSGPNLDRTTRRKLDSLGVTILGAETQHGHIPWDELLEDLANRGISSLLVEGGATLADDLMGTGFVDRISLYYGADEIGPKGILAPVSAAQLLQDAAFEVKSQALFGSDEFIEFVRS